MRVCRRCGQSKFKYNGVEQGKDGVVYACYICTVCSSGGHTVGIRLKEKPMNGVTIQQETRMIGSKDAIGEVLDEVATRINSRAELPGNDLTVSDAQFRDYASSQDCEAYRVKIEITVEKL